MRLANGITLRPGGVWRSSWVFWKAGIPLCTIFSNSCSENATWFAKKREEKPGILSKNDDFQSEQESKRPLSNRFRPPRTRENMRIRQYSTNVKKTQEGIQKKRKIWFFQKNLGFLVIFFDFWKWSPSVCLFFANQVAFSEHEPEIFV